MPRGSGDGFSRLMKREVKPSKNQDQRQTHAVSETAKEELFEDSDLQKELDKNLKLKKELEALKREFADQNRRKTKFLAEAKTKKKDNSQAKKRAGAYAKWQHVITAPEHCSKCAIQKFAPQSRETKK